MKQRLLSLHLLLALATLLLTRAASAQDYMTDTRAPKPVVWSGTDRDGGMIQGYPYERLSETELDEALAIAQSRIEVVRQYQLAEDTLDQLWVRANLYLGKQTDPAEFARNQSRVQQLRFDLLVATSRLKQAQQIARYPYMSSLDPIIQDKYLQVQGMSEAMTKAVFAEAEGEAWDERRALIASMLGDNQAGTNQDGLTSAQSSYLLEHFGVPSPDMLGRIEQALLDGNERLPKSLGLRAAPSLARLTLRDLEGSQNNYTLDPLLVLADVDAPGAARIAVDFFDQAGQGFRLRVLAALEYVNPFVSMNDWDYPSPEQLSNGTLLSHKATPRCLVSYWIPVVAKLTSESRTRSRITSRLGALASRGALTQDLQRALIDALNDANPKGSSELFQSIRTEPSNASNRPVLAAMLDHRDPQIRNVAAEDMLDFYNPVELYPFAKHADPKVRKAVAKSLQGRSVALSTFRHPQVPINAGTFVGAHVDASTAQTLATLLRDPDPAIRKVASNALCSSEWTFKDSTPYLHAAREADESIAEALLRAPIADAEIKSQVALILAKSNRSDVITQLDEFIVNRADLDNEIGVWGPILLMRAADTRHAFLSGYSDRVSSNQTRQEFIQNKTMSIMRRGLLSSVDGVTTAIQLALQRGDWILLGQAFNSKVNALQALKQLDEPTYLAVLKLACSEIEFMQEDRYTDLLEASLRMRVPGIKDDQAFRSILESSEAPQRCRLGLALVYRVAEYPEVEKSVFGILSNEPLEPNSHSFGLVGWSLSSNDDAEQLAIAQQAAAMLTERPLEALAALQHSAFVDGAPADYAMYVLHPSHHHLLASVGADDMVKNAYRAMLDAGWSDAYQSVLISGLESEYTVIWADSAEVAQGLQDPELIPVIAEILRGTSDAHKQSSLAQLLGSYMNREAGQELVACIGSSRDDRVRQHISMALSEIRTYLEQEAYWAGDSKPRATQDEAVRQLAQMLSSEDAKVRAEAIDGLVAFGAREYMPQFILLLKDEDTYVRKAARRALDYLQGKPPSESDDD